MSFATSSQWGPLSTPKAIKHLIIAIAVISLLSAAIQTICDQFGWSPGPQQLLSLSWWGISNFYLWQFVSFLFIQPYTPAGITLSFLISLSVTLYLMWILATSLYELIGKAAFLRLYFFCGITAAIITLLLTSLLGYNAVLEGPTPIILTLLTAWSMAHPDAQLLLFFLIPIQARWLIVGIIAAMTLIALSHWDIASLILYASAVFLGYAYSCIAWGWRSPFSETHRIDLFLTRLGVKAKMLLKWPQWLKKKSSSTKPTPPPSTQNKIVDIETGAPPADDEAFIDQMLAKISKYGERSLSWSERRRMQQISERKRKK